MPAAHFVQDAFDAGQWSPYAQGRFSHPKYKAALATCENMFPIDTNALVRRPGFQFAGTTRLGMPGKLVNFSFEDNLPYTLEFTDGHMRSFQGAQLTTDEANAAVSSISTAIPAVVSMTAVPGNWNKGDRVQFTLVDNAARSALPYLADRIFEIGALTGTTFALYDGLTGVPVSGTSIGWTAQNVNVSQVLDLGTIYTSGSWDNLRPIQNETAMILLAPNQRPQELDATPETGHSPATFSIADALFIDGPYLDPFPNSTVTPDVKTGLVTLTLGSQAYSSTTAYNIGDYVTSSSITYVSLANANEGNTPASSPTFWSVSSPGAVVGPGGFMTSDIGRHVRLLSEPPLWATGTTYTTGQVVTFNGGYWTALTGMTGATPTTGSINPNQPGNLATTWAPNAAAATWTWGRVVSLPTTGAIDPSTGTPIGNMTANGGLAAAFNGTQGNESQSAEGFVSGSIVHTDLYVGLSFGSGLAVTSAVVYPSTDKGFGYYGNSQLSYPTLTLRLYGSNSSPTSGTNGTLLGSTSVPAYTSKSQRNAFTINSTDQTTTYTHIWVTLDADTAGSPNTCFSIVAELGFTGSGAVPNGALVKVQLVGPPLMYTTTINTWQLGLYTDTNNVYPTCGCYSDGRLWLAGAVDNRFDACMTNGFANGQLVFSPTEPDGTVADDDAISYTFDSSDLNKFLWMIPDIQGIICGTVGGEWLIDAPAQGGFAPDNIRGRRVTKYGCANIEPQRTGLTTVFVQRYQRKLLEYVADAFSGKLSAPNLSEMARDVSSSGIAEIRYQQEITPIVWHRGNDGSLFGCSYKRTSLLSANPAELIGWHKHPLGSGRLVESMSVGPSTDGTLEALSIISNDPATGVRHVEVMRNVFDEEDDLITAWQLDDAVVPSCGITSGSNLILKGLSHLDGYTVVVFIAGLNVGSYQVQAGQITVPYGSAGGLFTQRWMTQLSALDPDLGDTAMPVDGGLQTVPCVVGFGFSSRGQTLRPNEPEIAGTRLGPAFGLYKRINKIAAQMHATQDVAFGGDFDHLHTAILRTEGGRNLEPTELYSGIWWDTLDEDQGLDGQICWEAHGPYPLALLALGGWIETNE